MAASFARRSAMSLFSSCGSSGVSVIGDLNARLERGFEELIEVAVEDGCGIADFDAGAQILDTRLIEHVRTDLVAPAHVRLRLFEHARRGVALVHFELVELRLQHL